MKAALVDDEDVIRQFMTAVLELHGFDVQAFVDPTECLPRWRGPDGGVSERGWTDIVVTDIRMPRMSGIDFAEELVSSGFDPARVAVMSGSWTDEDTERVGALGCARFAKPICIQHFSEWLTRAEIAMSRQRESSPA